MAGKYIALLLLFLAPFAHALCVGNHYVYFPYREEVLVFNKADGSLTPGGYSLSKIAVPVEPGGRVCATLGDDVYVIDGYSVWGSRVGRYRLDALGVWGLEVHRGHVVVLYTQSGGTEVLWLTPELRPAASYQFPPRRGASYVLAGAQDALWVVERDKTGNRSAVYMFAEPGAGRRVLEVEGPATLAKDGAGRAYLVTRDGVYALGRNITLLLKADLPAVGNVRAFVHRGRLLLAEYAEVEQYVVSARISRRLVSRVCALGETWTCIYFPQYWANVVDVELDGDRLYFAVVELHVRQYEWWESERVLIASHVPNATVRVKADERLEGKLRADAIPLAVGGLGFRELRVFPGRYAISVLACGGQYSEEVELKDGDLYEVKVTALRVRVEVVDLWMRQAQVPIAVSGDCSPVSGIGAVETDVPRTGAHLTVYLWRLDKQAGTVIITATPDGSVTARISGIRGDCELNDGVLVVRIYKDYVTWRELAITGAVTAALVAIIIAVIKLAIRGAEGSAGQLGARTR